MIYAGIDIAKLNHFASIISSDGEVLVKPFKFSNDFEGFRSFSIVLDMYDREQPLVCRESTAHYGNNLVEFLFAKGYRLCVLNPDLGRTEGKYPQHQDGQVGCYRNY